MCRNCDVFYKRFQCSLTRHQAYENGVISYSYGVVRADLKLKTKNKRRGYENSHLVNAVKKIVNENWSIYKAAKEFKVPWSTLKDHVSRHNLEDEHAEIAIPKLGRPFILPKEIELKFVKYIIEMQELGFGLSVIHVKKLAFDLSKSFDKNCLFNEDKAKAGSYWWRSFKERYGLSLRTPEKLAANRAAIGNRENLDDFYDKLEMTLNRLGLSNKPQQIFNCDETWLTIVVKPSKIVTQIGKKIVYSKTFAEKGFTQTVLGCCGADGTAVPPMIIFKGVRLVDGLNQNAPPGLVVRVSKNG